MSKPFIIDGHLDLSMNAMQWNRDLRMDLDQIKALEKGMNDKADRGNGTVSLPSMREGNVGFCFATLIARYAKPSHPLGGRNSPEQAWATVQGQLAWYQEMERQDEMWMVEDLESFEDFICQWDEDRHGIGYLEHMLTEQIVKEESVKKVGSCLIKCLSLIWFLMPHIYVTKVSGK